MIQEPEYIPCYYCGLKEHRSKVTFSLVLDDGQVVRICRECLEGRKRMQ